MRASLALLYVLAVAVVAAAASSAASTPNVRGTFVRSTPPTGCSPGEPCDPPPQAAFLVFTRNGHATRVRIGASGSFAVRLATGLYKVRVLPSQGSVSPMSLRVPRIGVIHPRFVQKTG
jgi:hypothetical protein